MSYPVGRLVEQKYRDVSLASLEQILPKEIHYPLYVHLINAFGYRNEWAAPLLAYIRWDDQERPFFKKSPGTPEAHRHKFLCTLTLSEGSPGTWNEKKRSFRSEDFVSPILEGPLEAWGDDSLFPEPSWTLQFLSVHLDEEGKWKNRATPLGEVTQRCLIRYFRDFDSGDLYIKGKTLFTESGLHLLEAINRLSRKQPQMVIEPATNSKMEKFFPMFKEHLTVRLRRSMEETGSLLAVPGWQQQEWREKGFQVALSNLLVAGHLLEVCVDSKGALIDSWEEKEKFFLQTSFDRMASLMELFFDPETLEIMNEEQRKAYNFPLFHAYHALRGAEQILSNFS